MPAVEFKDWLKQKRKARNLSQEELAELCGCTKSYISWLERGKGKSTSSRASLPSPEMQERLSMALAVTLPEVFNAMRSTIEGGNPLSENQERNELLAYYDGSPKKGKDMIKELAEAIYLKEVSSLKTYGSKIEDTENERVGG